MRWAMQKLYDQPALFRCCERALIGSKDHRLREVREELLCFFST
jgi:hypothetical protein